jgi:hypothetical protein
MLRANAARQCCAPVHGQRVRGVSSHAQRRSERHGLCARLQVDEAAPDWLKRYLVAKRAVEAELSASTGQLRSVIVRPSLIWNWKKFDVLPVIPVFNIASALGVPFIDKTVRVEDVGRSIVAGLLDESVSGVQRFEEMESLSAALDVPK